MLSLAPRMCLSCGPELSALYLMHCLLPVCVSSPNVGVIIGHEPPEQRTELIYWRSVRMLRLNIIYCTSTPYTELMSEVLAPQRLDAHDWNIFCIPPP